MNRTCVSSLIASGFLLLTLAPAHAISIATTAVTPDGAPGFRMGVYEVTNDQYVALLNAFPNDTYLYNTNMTTNARGGIIRSGSPGNYTYSVKPNMGNKPVNFVNAYDALRMANWLHNGQTTTSSHLTLGSYDLSTVFSEQSGVQIGNVARLSGATWVVPTVAEWLAAAQGTTITTEAQADSVGNVTNPGPGVVNYNFGADWNSLNGNLTTVGSTGNPSQWGTYDQYGNVEEVVIGAAIPVEPFFDGGLRGGHMFSNAAGLNATVITSILQSGNETQYSGIRLAFVPEPRSIALALCAAAGLGLAWIKRRVRP